MKTSSLKNKPRCNYILVFYIRKFYGVLFCPGQRSGDGEQESPPSSSHEVEPRRPISRMKSLMRDELLINVQKFATQVLNVVVPCVCMCLYVWMHFIYLLGYIIIAERSEAERGLVIVT